MVDARAMSRHLQNLDKCEAMLKPDHISRGGQNKAINDDYEAYLVAKIYYAGYVMGKFEAELSDEDILTLYKEGYKNSESQRINHEW
jgi:hypothetical protein